MVYKKTYTEPAINKKEILRYCGCKDADEKILNLINESVKEAVPKLSYRVCYSIFDIEIKDTECDLGFTKVQSADLSKNLAGCKKSIVFGATVGIEIDRLISKYAKISPAKAVIMQSIGAERIEALCDTFCEDMAQTFILKPRFSAGYGDLPLEFQKDIFSVLDCHKQIGLTLNSSLMMSPSKSVTAIIGIRS